MSENAVSVTSGSLFSMIGAIMLNITPEGLFQVAFYGLVGGIMGYIGKFLASYIKNKFFKKNERTNR